MNTRSISRRFLVTSGAAVLLASAAAATAEAKTGDVVKRGTCSGRSVWKLKLSPENGAIASEFQVDSNVPGQTWMVQITDNGVKVFAGNRVTKAPSGSFTIRRTSPNLAGPDAFAAVATNPTTGETCSAAASF